MGIQKGLCCVAVCTSLVTVGMTALADDQQAPGAAPAVVVVAAPAPAGEAGVRLPVSYTERGITNPAMILSPVLDVSLIRIQPAVAGLAVPAATGAALTLGAGFSITDDFGVRATVVNAQFASNDTEYLGPTVGATYRFLKGDFEMGVALDMLISTPAPVGVVIGPSIPMRLHMGKAAVLDIQPTIPISTPEKTTVGLNVPVAVAYDIVEPSVHIGANTGVAMTFNPPQGVTVGDTFSVPLGVFAGYAVPGKDGPIVDIDPYFRWPALFIPGAGDGLSKAQAGIFQLGVTVTGYIYL